LKKNAKSNSSLRDNSDGRAANALDDLDLKIVGLLVSSGANNKDISRRLDIPLSTIQRRTRNLFDKGLVTSKVQVNYKEFGISRGLMHIYLHDGDAMGIAKKVSDIDGVIAVTIHIGNSDIVAEIVYKNGMSIMQIISNIKKIQGIEKVVWSEEIYSVPFRKSIDALLRR
jgi:DNA-binding Lrp family transcriptional regulator